MTKTNPKEIGNRLKTLRKKQGFTQRQVADYLDISQSQYAKYESGTRTPKLTIILKLSNVYHAPIEHILYNEPIQNDVPLFKAKRHIPLKTIANMNQILINLHEMHQLEK